MNNNLFENDILIAYSLARIYNNIYRFNEHLVFLLVFPTFLAKILRLFKHFMLAKTIAENQCRMKSFPDNVRLMNFDN